MSKLESIVTKEVERHGFRLITLERDGNDVMAFCRKGSFGNEVCFMFSIEDGRVYFVKMMEGEQDVN